MKTSFEVGSNFLEFSGLFHCSIIKVLLSLTAFNNGLNKPFSGAFLSFAQRVSKE